ncbi:hypothetical protein PRZ48_013607 [Zasmidium cellare]|uniref:DUF7136 domain-containing protein n=1 Tax=Zasmidium cellare TaxID=395010 RepID=A0ABR0E226_ZASCE|nr:hypothetical protein PRZ48_013607 [Zasmidium cellare]
MFRLNYLGLVPILASPLALAAASPGILEVDLVFPQNGTYAPVPLMPVVFALRNIALASPLDLSISWTFNERGSIDSGSWDGRQNLTHLNASSSDPYLYNSFIPSLAGVESQWVLTWILETGNCSGPGLGLTSFASQYNHIVFTTRNTSQPPDLGAAASSTTCGKNASSAFNVTAIEEVSLAENFDGQPSCAVLGASPTVQGPSGITINPSAASSNVPMQMKANEARAVHPFNQLLPKAAPISANFVWNSVKR